MWKPPSAKTKSGNDANKLDDNLSAYYKISTKLVETWGRFHKFVHALYQTVHAIRTTFEKLTVAITLAQVVKDQHGAQNILSEVWFLRYI